MISEEINKKIDELRQDNSSGAQEFIGKALKIINLQLDLIEDKDKEGWHVIKVKDYHDVVDGEHWSDFGFSYREVS